MPEGDEQAGEAKKGDVPAHWRLPALETGRHSRRDDHHHDIGRERHNHHRNTRRHVTPDQIARRDQHRRCEGEQSRGRDSAGPRLRNQKSASEAETRRRGPP
jgi:hypothetical protein